MRRLLSLFLAAALSFAPSWAVADLRAIANGPPVGTYTQAQQITAAQALRTPYILAKSTIPMISVSTGSIANNGALTAITALPRTFANAYMLFPAGAIAAGVPAAATYYYVQCSSTTACTIFNNPYVSGVPTIPASPTAFSTTGPGAFTGSTAADTALTFTMPAGTMGANGALRMWTLWGSNNTANAKTAQVKLGATAVLSGSLLSVLGAADFRIITNAGSASSQIGANTGFVSGVNTSTGNLTTAAINTGADATISVVMQKATATDNMWLEVGIFEVLSDGT